MLLMLERNSLSKFFKDYIVNSVSKVVYCLDTELYFYLKKMEILVDIAYLSEGKVYLCDGSIYEGTIITKESEIYDEFIKYNTTKISQNREYNKFIDRYNYITTQEDYMIDMTQ